jgi:hypothetical protein
VKFDKKLCAALIVLSLLAVGTTYAALLTYFGMITTTANVEQAVLLDGFDWTQPITEEVTVAGGESLCRPHWLQSQTDIPVMVQFATSITPAEAGITVTYRKPLGYAFSGTTYAITGDYYPADITIEDGECNVTWTFDMVAGKTLEGNGHWGYGVAISLDGENASFQIHNNDGTDAGFPWGTHLYSPYTDGWVSSSTNTPVTELDWVTCAGDRDYADNPTGIFTVTIDKCMLGSEFYWAVWVGVGGFYAPNNGYSSYPDGFIWQGAVDGYYELAAITEELSGPFALQPGEHLDFVICYEFAVNIMPKTYAIKTEVNPA